MHTSTLRLTTLARKLGFSAAVAAATLAAPLAQADIITFNTPISVPQTFNGVYINLLTGANAPTTAAVPGWDFGPWGTSTLNFFWPATPTNSFGGVSNGTTYTDLAPGSVVSSSSTYLLSAQAIATTAFQAGGTHTLGFRFFNEATSAVNYGYLTMTTTGTTGFPATITGWSFDNTGAAITVVPEPGTAAMLSMGALALGALQLRRRRKG